MLKIVSYTADGSKLCIIHVPSDSKDYKYYSESGLTDDYSKAKTFDSIEEAQQFLDNI